ncbi:5'-3' exonuclease N-terminal resolvase-like domain protein [Theileria parva strain Muguga]|uniref:5'-3' exonuclease, putative n=1 Tax=Theileria parva TaxID=5875 RepID=Q4N4V3_THEPA|nr:5'-3' exonuclease N-terminal resolvase-like domain protein [Theileria parva strain Muguga]EAN32820.1 5'-3' exonuclease N-terminal resolvase-like domain protein [Theileria parva strain Muguga]|eukprot:XP_765103.1 5'-3' exonuclease [Theileria parva strain Muguga]
MKLKFVIYFLLIFNGVEGLNFFNFNFNYGIQPTHNYNKHRNNKQNKHNKNNKISKYLSKNVNNVYNWKNGLKGLGYISTTLKGINLGYKTDSVNAPDRVMIVDGTGLAYRCFFALPDLKTSKGTDIGCLMGFMNSLARLHRMFDPKYIGVVFDSPGANDEKRDIWPEYKLNRQVVSYSLRNQLGWIREFCAILGLPVFIEPSTEADDIITSMITFFREYSKSQPNENADSSVTPKSTLNNSNLPGTSMNFHRTETMQKAVRGIFDRYSQELKGNSVQALPYRDYPLKAEDNSVENDKVYRGYDITVVTADKDLLQILSENDANKVNVKIVQPHKSYRIVNQHTVKQEYGIDPERFSEYLALVGDTADNIPGIMGIGPKTAPKLIQKYQSFDDILRSEEITKLSSKGGKYRESVRMAHEFHSIVKLKKNLRVLKSMDQLVKSNALTCQLSKFLKMFSLQKASSKWSMFTKP